MTDQELIDMWNLSNQEVIENSDDMTQSEGDIISMLDTVDSLFAATELSKRGYLLTNDNQWIKKKAE